MGSNQMMMILASIVGFFIVLRLIQTPRRISPKKALTLQQAGAAINDVRQPSEYSGGHIKGAVIIPLDKIDGTAKKFSKETV